MSSTLRELIDSNHRLADSIFDQSAAINKLVPIMDRLRGDVYTLLNNYDLDRANSDLRMRDVGEKLARLLDLRDDVKGIAKEITGVHKLPPVPERESRLVETIHAFEKLSPVTKVFVFILAIVLAASGWLTHLITG